MKKRNTNLSDYKNEIAYFKLIEDSPDGFIVIDKEGIVHFVNKKAKEILILDESEIIGKQLGLPILSDENAEIELPQKDGSVKSVELRIAETVWDNVDSYLCSLRDVTDRKKTEEELRKHQELLQKTGELAKVGGWEINLHDQSIYWTKTTRLIHEVSDDYIPNFSDALDFFKGESKHRLKESIEEAVKFGKDYNLILEFVTAKGNHKWLHVLGIAETFKGKCIRLWGVIQDITEQKEAELRLRQSNERFRVALSDSSIVVWQQDAELRYKWIYNINANLKEEDIIGKSDEEILTNPEEIKQLKEIKQRVLSTGLKETHEVRTILKEEPFYYRLNVEPLFNDKGKIEGITCVSVNITELKLAYEELETAKERAEESDKLKSAFLANISHEIRTPMNGILGFTNLLKKPGMEEMRQKEFIDVIQKSGMRMLNIIDQLIDVAKIESNQTEILREKTDIHELLQQLYNFFSVEAEAAGLELKLNKHLADEEFYITTDSVKLNQILTNLIKNAIKFTKEGSVEFGYYLANNSLQFYVSDSGIGIEEDKQKMIFERFRQVETTFTREFEGAGLGLSISKAYIEMLGGNIRVESKKDMGSTFFFTIPINQQASAEENDTYKNPKTQAYSSPKNITILIAEDDEVSYDLFEAITAEKGIKLIRASNGKEAIEKLDSNSSVDLVLMDIKMPGMNGYEATRIIKEKYPQLPVVIQTAFASSKDKETAFKAGCDDFITKPIDEDNLFDILNKYFTEKPGK